MFGFLRNWRRLSASGVSRYLGAFAFSAARVVATFPARGNANLRSIDCAWDTNEGPATATITNKGLMIDIGLHGVDRACSGMMKLNYKRKIPDEVYWKAAHHDAALPGRAGLRLSRRRRASQVLADQMPYSSPR